MSLPPVGLIYLGAIVIHLQGRGSSTRRQHLGNVEDVRSSTVRPPANVIKDAYGHIQPRGSVIGLIHMFALGGRSSYFRCSEC